MKFIIFYNECLRSKIIYSQFIKKNKKNIKAVIKLPINISSKNKFFLIKKGIFNDNAYSYILFQLFQTLIYNISSNFFFSNIEHLCKKLNIKFFELKKFPKKKELISLVENYESKDIFFISTTYILKHEDLMIKNPILNLHEADPKNYRGSALYFRLANDKQEYMKTVIMEPTSKIDAGRIVCSSSTQKIKNLSVFRIILTGYKLQNILMSKINKIRIKKKYPKIKNNDKSEIYSFPSRKLEKKLHKKDIETIILKDYFFILYLSIIKDVNKLYSKINAYLKK